MHELLVHFGDFLSIASFPIIFSHSEGSLFTLLLVSFVVQKLLSLIRSRLFIFVFISITLKRWVIEDLAVIYVRVICLMCTIFKVFTEFVTILLLFYVLVFWPRGMWNLISSTRTRTCTPCIGTQNLNCWTARKIPALAYDGL